MKKWIFGSFLTSLLMANLALADGHRKMSVEHLDNGASYFKINIQDEDGLLEGQYYGWCADWAKQIQDNVFYPVKFYSSLLENFPVGVVDHPENLDEMNWLLNKHFVGKYAPDNLGRFTSGDVQLAIWTLLDDNFDSSTVGPFSQARVYLLVNWALTKGSGFYPKCREVVGIILDPGTVQSTIVEIRRDHFRKCVVPEGDI